MKIINLFLIIAMLLAVASCSPQKRLDRFLHRHPEFITDTVIYDTIVVPEMVHDTMVQALPGDTVVIEKENVQVQIIRLSADSLDVRIERHEVKIPVRYRVSQIKHSSVKADKKLNFFILGMLLMLAHIIMLYLFMRLLFYKFRK